MVLPRSDGAGSARPLSGYGLGRPVSLVTQKSAPSGALGWCEKELKSSGSVMTLSSGVQGEPVATSPIGTKLFVSIAFGVGLRDVSAQVQGVGIALYDSASSRTAYAVFVAPQRLKCSFPWSWFRRDESEIHQDFRSRSQPYRLDKRPIRGK